MCEDRFVLRCHNNNYEFSTCILRMYVLRVIVMVMVMGVGVYVCGRDGNNGFILFTVDYLYVNE